MFPSHGRLALAAAVFTVTLSLLFAPSPAAGSAPHADVTFADGAHARIPFELRTQHIWVRGTVNGSDSVWIVIDSGAGSALLSQELAHDLGLRAIGQHNALGAGGAQTIDMVEDVTIRLPGCALHRRQMGAIDLSAFRLQAGRPMGAIVGHDLFASCIVRFDYAAGVIDVWDADHPPADLPGIALPLTFSQNLPYVEGTLDLAGRAPISGRFVLDSGSGLALALAPEVVRRESLATAFPRTLVSFGRGVGGDVRHQTGRARSFTLGTLEFKAPTVSMPDSGAGHISVAGSIGNIGGQLLGRCRVTFDYSRKLVRFEPGPGFDGPFEADMFGAALQRTEAGVTVRWVNVDTPAAEAGLEVGDLITRMDGEPCDSFDNVTLREHLQGEGRELRLELQRAGERPREVTAKLRRLI